MLQELNMTKKTSGPARQRCVLPVWRSQASRDLHWKVLHDRG